MLPHLELLRSVVEVSTFVVRGGQDRRHAARSQTARHMDSRHPDSRKSERRSSDRRAENRRAPVSRRRTRTGRIGSDAATRELSVTVSIGVAEANAKTSGVEQVIQAADKALYQAKQAGRNRVEPTIMPRPAKASRSIA